MVGRKQRELLNAVCPKRVSEESPNDKLATWPVFSTGDILIRVCNSINSGDVHSAMDHQLYLIEYFVQISGGRVKLTELKYLLVVMEHMCECAALMPQCRRALQMLLNLCQEPPAASNRIEIVEGEDVIADYLTGLGNCLILVNDPEIDGLIIGALRCLLGKKGMQYYTHDFVVKALLKSELADRLSKLVYVVDAAVYSNILDLAIKCIHLSDDFATDFLTDDVIYFLLSRVNLRVTTADHDSNNINDSTRSLLWRLVNSSGKRKTKVSLCHQEAILQILRKWLRREVLFGKPHVRNDVAGIIGKILFVYQCDKMLKSNILDDICLLAFATEFEIKYSWAKSVEFLPTPENLIFKKILMLIISRVYKDIRMRMVADNYSVFNGLVLMLGLEPEKTSISSWPLNYRCELMKYALQIIPVLAEFSQEQYLASGVTLKILDSLTHCDQRSPLTKYSLQCLCSLLIRGISASHFVNCNASVIILDLTFSILKCSLTKLNQKLLSQCFFLLSNLHETSPPKEHSLALVSSIGLEIIKRMQKPRDDDFEMDGG